MKPAFIPLIVSIIAVLLLVGGYVLWYGEVKALGARSVELSSEIQAKDRARARTASARSAEADLVAQEAFVASHLVSTADIVSFLEQLENTGKAFGAEVHVASVQGEDKPSEGRIALSLSVTGSFDAVMRTVGAIEVGPHAVSVTDLSLDTSDGKIWSANGAFVVATEIPAP